MHKAKELYYVEVGSISNKRSKSKNRERSCTEKIRYKTKIKAARAARAYNRSIVIRNADVQSYDCRHCAGWHIGHDYQDFKKRKKARLLDAELDILFLLHPAPSLMAANKRTKVLRTFTQRSRRGIAA